MRLLLFLVLCLSLFGYGQTKREREYRIDREAFPEKALNDLGNYLDDVKRLRFFKEEDGDRESFEAKFKKGRLKYSVEFNQNGMLEDVEFIVKKNDLPDESYTAILADLQQKFSKYRIKKIQQQYLHPPTDDVAKTLRAAFQNLLLPEIRYELIVQGKKDGAWASFEITYDAEGHHLSTRTIVTAKYDHVLY